jgi:hypothetical protein
VVYESYPAEFRKENDDGLIEYLKLQFDRVRTLVEQRSTLTAAALLKDVETTNTDTAELDREQARREHRRNHDLILREAQAYLALVRAWFETETDGMRATANALVRRAEANPIDDISFIELARLLDAIGIVRHDCFVIFVKLLRAIDGLESDERDQWDDDPIQNDHNGSAKLALACIDRSEGAWRAIDRWYPSCGTARMLADHLAGLRRTVEGRFPHARAFLRPGFDALVTPA